MSANVRICRVLGRFNLKDIKVVKKFLDDYAMRLKYGLIDERMLSRDVVLLTFNELVDDKTIDEFVHEFLACHALVYTHAIKPVIAA